MAPLLYLIGCVTLTSLAVLESRTRNRLQRVQLLFTLLCALTFCGVFALLVAAAQVNGGEFQGPALLGVLLLTGGSLVVMTRTSRRFRAMR